MRGAASASCGARYVMDLQPSRAYEVWRIHPRYVKAYLLGAKNDTNDAAAICEAVQRPNMRFVPHKSSLQTDIQCIHRIRQRYIRSRTALINQARGLLAEHGIVIRQGANHLRKHLPLLIGDDENNFSPLNKKHRPGQKLGLCFLFHSVYSARHILSQFPAEFLPKLSYNMLL